MLDLSETAPSPSLQLAALAGPRVPEAPLADCPRNPCLEAILKGDICLPGGAVRTLASLLEDAAAQFPSITQSLRRVLSGAGVKVAIFESGLCLLVSNTSDGLACLLHGTGFEQWMPGKGAEGHVRRWVEALRFAPGARPTNPLQFVDRPSRATAIPMSVVRAHIQQPPQQ